MSMPLHACVCDLNSLARAQIRESFAVKFALLGGASPAYDGPTRVIGNSGETCHGPRQLYFLGVERCWNLEVPPCSNQTNESVLALWLPEFFRMIAPFYLPHISERLVWTGIQPNCLLYVPITFVDLPLVHSRPVNIGALTASHQVASADAHIDLGSGCAS